MWASAEPGGCEFSASFYALGQVKNKVDTPLAFSLMKQAKVIHNCSFLSSTISAEESSISDSNEQTLNVNKTCWQK